MKILFALLCSVVVASAQFAAPFRGEYLGVLVPASNCSNERLTVTVTVDASGSLAATIYDFDANPVTVFYGTMASNGRAVMVTGDPLAPDYDGSAPTNAWLVKLTAGAKSGKISGSVDARAKAGCRYTFTALRRFKVAQ